MTESAKPEKKTRSGRTTVVAIAAAVVVLLAGAVVGVNVVAEQQAQRAFDEAAAAFQTAEKQQLAAQQRLSKAQQDAAAEHGRGTALLAATDATMLSEEAPKTALQESIATLAETAGIEAAGSGEGADTAQSRSSTDTKQTNETNEAPAPSGRDEKQAAAAKLVAQAIALEKQAKSLEQESKGVAAGTKALRESELAVLAAAAAKAATLEIPEHASQESKDAFAAAVAALQKPGDDADPAALLQAYQDAWQAIVASNEEARRALDPASIEPTYIRGILVVNKSYALPSWYGEGLAGETVAAFNAMQAEAASLGLDIYISSGFRSYWSQQSIYNRYVAADGQAAADRYSARPGHSEHQSGLTFDLNSIDESFAYTAEGQWVRDNAHRFGFVIRYPQGKEHITGYIWEPWHLRYLGTGVATELYNSGLSLEEYLGITSQYAD